MVSRISKLIIIVLIIALFSSASFLLGYHFYIIGTPIPYLKKPGLPFAVNETIRHVQDKYYDPVSQQKLINGAVEGIISSLDDPYAQYLDSKHYDKFRFHMKGNYSGVGMYIQGKKNQIIVTEVFNESPAEKKGLKKGDLIIEIDGKPTAKMNPEVAAKSIQGKEGTIVGLLISRNGKRKEYRIKRAKIDFPNLVSKMKNSSTGYIKMHSFTDDTGEKMKNAISKLEGQGMKKLILDLRGNPGGELSEAVNITSLFLKDGVVLKTVNRKKQETVYNANGNHSFSGKMVVLVDEGSASASEIVAGALKDHKRALVIGTKTFGKGIVQEVVMLSNGGAIIIPSQQWLTPSGRSISKQGIKPNETIKDPDKQLDAALRHLAN